MTRRFYSLLLATLLLFRTAGFPQLTSPSPDQLRRIPAPPTEATPAALEQRGDELRAEKAYLDARDYYAAALKKVPREDKDRVAEVQNKLGIAELQLEHLGDAKKAFQRAIKLNKLYPEAYNNLGATFYLENKPKKAIREYLKALQLNDQSGSFHANLGTAYLARKRYDKMAVEYGRAIQLDPGIFERTSGVGASLQLQTPEERARFDYALARIYARMGNAERSLHYLRQALEDGYRPISSIYKDAEFAALRKDPRFTALLASPPVAIRAQ